MDRPRVAEPPRVWRPRGRPVHERAAAAGLCRRGPSDEVWALQQTQQQALRVHAQSSRYSGLRRLTLCPRCPQVVPAQYAFVLHTAHPITRNRGDMFGEMVVGLGETLVGNHPGRALAFVGAEGAPPLC